MAELKMISDHKDYCTADDHRFELLCVSGLTGLFDDITGEDEEEVYLVVTKKPQDDNDYRFQIRDDGSWVRVMTKSGWVEYQLYYDISEFLVENTRDTRPKIEGWPYEGFVSVELPK
ncbi:MAG: hypothetical protein ACXABY_16130 [Candidatus Thorarchaeota archaeon]|jgi:hypothetical protein